MKSPSANWFSLVLSLINNNKYGCLQISDDIELQKYFQGECR